MGVGWRGGLGPGRLELGPVGSGLGWVGLGWVCSFFLFFLFFWGGGGTLLFVCFFPSLSCIRLAGCRSGRRLEAFFSAGDRHGRFRFARESGGACPYRWLAGWWLNVLALVVFVAAVFFFCLVW